VTQTQRKPKKHLKDSGDFEAFCNTLKVWT